MEPDYLTQEHGSDHLQSRILLQLVADMREVRDTMNELKNNPQYTDEHKEFVEAEIERAKKREAIVEDATNKTIGAVVVSGVVGFIAFLGYAIREYLKTIGIHL